MSDYEHLLVLLASPCAHVLPALDLDFVLDAFEFAAPETAPVTPGDPDTIWWCPDRDLVLNMAAGW